MPLFEFIEKELEFFLRPAGGGVHLFSSGLSEQKEFQKKWYGVDLEGEIKDQFRKHLHKIRGAKVLFLGLPSDVGAGFRRGSNIAPLAFRHYALRRDPTFLSWCKSLGIVDIGDIFCVPQLLHDDMLSEEQKKRVREDLISQAHVRGKLISDSTFMNAEYIHKILNSESFPVSPLSICHHVISLARQINPGANWFVLGGDHSCTWPVILGLHDPDEKRGIVHIDAHTDLLASRLGIPYCFATWSYHANELIGRQKRLVQVGIRATRFSKTHWEKELDVKQYWAEDCLAYPDKVCDSICSHLRDLKLDTLYLSNDIDGTDSYWANATGTPEPNGLTPDFVFDLIARLGREFCVKGADLMELAPPLDQGESLERTMDVSYRYVKQSLAVLAKA